MLFNNLIPRRFNSSFIQALKITPPSTYSLAFTKPAVNRLSALATTGDALRIKVSSGGCHGYQYDLELVKLDEQLQKLKSGAEGMIFFELPFEKPTEEELQSVLAAQPSAKITPLNTQNKGDPQVLVSIDDLSLELLDKTTLDFHKQLIGSQFKIVGGNMKSSCGCGSSFDI